MNSIRVEVAYALPDRQWLLTLELPAGSTIRQALHRPELSETLPVLDPTALPVGIFSRRCDLDTVLQEGDRIELYRPLRIDPKEARRHRARKRQRLSVVDRPRSEPADRSRNTE